MARGTQELGRPPCSTLLAVRETVTINPSSLWHMVSPLPSPDPFLSPYTRLSLEWALTRLQASWLVGSIKRIEVAQHYTSHTPSGQPDGGVQNYTLALPWGCALGQPVKQALALVREGGTFLPAKIERKKEKKRSDHICAEVKM